MNTAGPPSTAERTLGIEAEEDFLEEYPETQGLLQPYFGLPSTEERVPSGTWYHAGAENHDQRTYAPQAPPYGSTLTQQGTIFTPVHSLEPAVYGQQSYGYPSQSGYYLSGTLVGNPPVVWWARSPGPYGNYGYGYGQGSNIYHTQSNDDRLPFHYQTNRGLSDYPSQPQLPGNARPMTAVQQQVNAMESPSLRTNPFIGKPQSTLHPTIGQGRATTLTSQSAASTQRLEDIRLMGYRGQFSDSRYAGSYEDDVESRSILMVDTPTPSYNISPPPRVPCPPLPAEYSLVSRHLAPVQTSEMGSQRAISRVTISNTHLQSSPEFPREGEIGFSGLGVATEDMQSPGRSYPTWLL